MKKNQSKTFFVITAVFLCVSAFVFSVSAQISRPEPEMTVSGFRLGEEDANRALLQNYALRYDNEREQPKYFFYNEYGTQVMTVTAHSKERPHFVVAIEVFAVGRTYQNKHYQLKEEDFFTTESGFFIGARQSATSMLFAAPNVTRPKEVIKKKGAPERDEKDGKARTLFYQFNAENSAAQQESVMKKAALNSAAKFSGAYKAEYRFVKDKLQRFSISIDAVPPAQIKF
jgi:hypothetical protein